MYGHMNGSGKLNQENVIVIIIIMMGWLACLPFGAVLVETDRVYRVLEVDNDMSKDVNIQMRNIQKHGDQRYTKIDNFVDDENGIFEY